MSKYLDFLPVRVSTEEALHVLSGVRAKLDAAGDWRDVIWRALKRTADMVTTQISRDIRKKYYVTHSGIVKSIKRHWRRGDNPGIQLVFEHQGHVRLVKFGAKQRVKGVSVKVLKSGSRKFIQPGGRLNILTTNKGRAAVFVAKNNVFARMEGKDRPLILYGPSFMSFFTTAGVARGLNDLSREILEKRLLHEADRFLTKLGEKS